MNIWQSIARNIRATVQAGAISPLQRLLGLGTPAPDSAGFGITFTIAIVALSAKMAKSEVEAFRRVCVFPDSETDNVRRVFELARQDVSGFETYARQIGRLLADEPRMRRDVLEALFAIAAADGLLHDSEERYLEVVAHHLGITDAEFKWVRSLFVNDADSPYHVLGVEPSASDAEVKRRYRELVLEHHPDKLMGRGVPQEFVAIAERALARLNAAYDVIAKERGL